MTAATLKRTLITLTLGSLAFAGCDEGSEPDDEAGDDIEETEGESEQTEGEPGDTEGEPDETEGEPDETEGEPDDTDPDEEPSVELCEDRGASRACNTEQGEDGIQYCDTSYASGTPSLEWHDCLVSIVCTPGDSRDCGGEEGIDEVCDLYDGVPDWDTNQDEWGGCNTPLVLSFDGRPARMMAAGAATFDLDGVGRCITTDWPEASTPWLALDRDGNGSIDSGRELFGSGTRLSSGHRAPNGFAALAELDDNGDGRIDLRDQAFGDLVLWSDHDGDRSSTFAETELLSHRQVLSIELGYHIDRQCDDRGNCGVERAGFVFIDEHGAVRTGEVVDLHLSCQ